MRIEAHGGFQNPKKETRPLKFCCTNCRCKFVADPGEYIEGKENTNAIASKDPRPRTKLYVSVCPECNEKETDSVPILYTMLFDGNKVYFAANVYLIDEMNITGISNPWLTRRRSKKFSLPSRQSKTPKKTANSYSRMREIL